MANDFAQGAAVSNEINRGKDNPFNVILGRFNEAMARKTKER